MYLHYSIDITTEQSFGDMELLKVKIWILKMHHYVGFLQIRSQISFLLIIKELTPYLAMNLTTSDYPV